MSANNQGEPAFIFLLTIAVFAALGWMIWHVTQDFWLSYVIRWLRFAELGILNIFTHRYGACLDWLRYAQVQTMAPNIPGLTNACYGPQFLSTVAPQDLASYYRISTPALSLLGVEAMSFYRWPISAALLAVASKVLFFSPNTKFKVKHTLETIIATQAKMWPVIMPIVKFNPSKSGRILGSAIPDKLPLFAEALSPEEWIAWNRIPVVNGIPDKDAARRAFVRQLGPRWTGIHALPIHMKALMAAFALRGAQKRDDSENLLGRLALAWSPEKGFQIDATQRSEIEKILRDPEVGGKIAAIADQFAWRTTAILGALKWARSMGGVVPPAHFIWLRAEDRALWYPLNNLGRRSFHSEGAGAMAHFMAEEAAKKPLPIPRVETAIVTLNLYLHDPDKRPVPIPPNESAVKA